MDIQEKIPYKGIRKVIGKRMAESCTYPHTHDTVEVDMSVVMALRTEINEESEDKLTFNDFIIKAVSQSLQEVPVVNSSLIENEIIVYKSINIGVITAIPGGLIAPVIKESQEKDIFEISREIKVLAQKAKEGKLMPDDYSNGTFSISNVGMLDIDSFIPLLLPPQAALLGVANIKKRPVVVTKDGEDRIAIRPTMNIVISADHRILDGVPMAKFVNTVKKLLEKPNMLLPDQA